MTPDEDAGTGMSGERKEQNAEFADSDQEFGGGTGEMEYGEDEERVGEEGVVKEAPLGPDEVADEEVAGAPPVRDIEAAGEPEEEALED